MAPPDTQSTDRLTDLENRLELHRTSVTTRLDQQAQDILEIKQELKQAMGRIEDFMKHFSEKMSLPRSYCGEATSNRYGR